MQRRHAPIWIVLVFLGLSGCGNTDLFEAEGPPVNITGRVFFRGYSLPGGWIVFSADPDFGAGTETLMAPLARDGSFQASDGKQIGLKPGYYRIALSASTTNQWQLPIRYCDPSTSGLKCMVQANQPLRIRLELD